jgi:cell wall-associated NlpC family hydrolase
MKRLIISVALILVLAASLAAQSTDSASSSTSFLEGIRASILKNLGRPYVWGASGMKSFDCSGFIWRVMYDNGILLKRTTARKFYMMLPAASKEDQGKFGTLVFFDNLKHVGMIDSPQFFYHAQVSVGTNHSPMNSFWRQKIYGFRRLPAPEAPPAQ